MLHNNSREPQFFSSQRNHYQDPIATIYSKIKEKMNSDFGCCFQISDGADSLMIYYGNDAARQLVNSLKRSVNNILQNGSAEEKLNLRKIFGSLEAGQCTFEKLIQDVAMLDAINRKSEVSYMLSFLQRESSLRPPSHR